jgi:hypothetical protein
MSYYAFCDTDASPTFLLIMKACIRRKRRSDASARSGKGGEEASEGERKEGTEVRGGRAEGSVRERMGGEGSGGEGSRREGRGGAGSAVEGREGRGV